MKKDRYVVFPNPNEAKDFVAKLDALMGNPDTWDIPNEHPFDDRAVIAWNDTYLGPFAELLNGLETITPDEAREQGWYFHPLFRGPFAQARIKLEEAQLLFDGLKATEAGHNFPAYKALFFSYLSSIYSLKEALQSACKKLGKTEEDWWEAQFMKIVNDPVLKGTYDLNNQQKHGLNLAPLEVRARLYGACLPVTPDAICSEGAYCIAFKGTAQERRIFINGLESRMIVALRSADGSVLGNPIELSEKVLHFYEEILFEARNRFGI